MEKNDISKPLVRIIDDDAPLRDALALLLEVQGYETMQFSSGLEFLKADIPSRPGCIILDFKMPEITGMQLQQIMNEREIDLPIVFLTAFADVDQTVSVFKKGAFDLLQKPVSDDKLIEAVVNAVQKDLEKKNKLKSPDELKQLISTLTTREREVLNLACLGLMNKTIAERLGISLRTVKFHRASAYRKLNIHSTSDLSQLVSLLSQ